MEILIKNLLKVLGEYYGYGISDMHTKNVFREKYKNINKEFIKTPLLKAKMCYYICYFKLDDIYFNEIVKYENVYPNVPILSL